MYTNLFKQSKQVTVVPAVFLSQPPCCNKEWPSVTLDKITFLSSLKCAGFVEQNV